MKLLALFLLLASPVLAQVPNITSVNPNTGLNLGGDTVTIAGTNLSGATQVFFGTYTASIIGVSAESVTVTSPQVTGYGVFPVYVKSGPYNSNSLNFTYTRLTPTSTQTSTSTPTATNTSTGTSTATCTSTCTNTCTNTVTKTPTITGTPTNTSTATATNTPSPTATSTFTPTYTPTITPTPIPAFTGTLSFLNLSPTPSPVALTFVAGVLYGVH